MKFDEFEELMHSNGVNSLAEIARMLNTTPQAVSNWKSRNQIPNHIILRINSSTTNFINIDKSGRELPSGSLGFGQRSFIAQSPKEDDVVTISDFFLVIAEQIKLIFLTVFVSVFFSFTYVQFLKIPTYVSSAVILLPQNKTSSLGGLANIASQFGVNVPSAAQADLSSPSLFPDLVKSRTFAEKILDKKFNTDRHGKELSLLEIFTNNDNSQNIGRDTLVTQALNSLNEAIEFSSNSSGSFSTLSISIFEPLLAKELAELVLQELQLLNRYFKSQNVSEKIQFINQRIKSVDVELKKSELLLKVFNEKNRQISSPSLQLEQERLERDVEIQKNIFLTLKQQLELAKIEEVQESNVVQVLDRPQIPLNPSNKNLKITLILSTILGFGLGVFLAIIRTYFNSENQEERKKFRKIKHFIRKKSKDIFYDSKLTGIITVFLIAGLPFYIGHESKNPVFFGMYSQKLFLIIILYILVLLVFSSLFLRSFKNNN